MHTRYIARQPIFDRQMQVAGYELFFRASADNHFHGERNATSQLVADSTMLFRLESLVRGKKAFINVSQEELEAGLPLLLPPGNTVVEVSTVRIAGETTYASCEALLRAGYQLALDEQGGTEHWERLLPLASYVKLDLAACANGNRRGANYKNVSVIAKNVESQECFKRACELGCVCFQGFFFLRPEILSCADYPAAKLNSLRLLQQCSLQQLEYAAIEEILKQEPGLLYKLLRYLNSPAVGLQTPVRSVPHAIALLGEKEFRRWASVMAVVSLSDGRTTEVVRTALTRAFFCEALAPQLNLSARAPELFLLGLFSLLDVILGRPVMEAIEELPLAEDLKQALTGGENRLSDVLQAVVSYERADWEQFFAAANRAKLIEHSTPEHFETAARHVAKIPVE